MKLRYIFCFFLSVSFIFTSLNFYKGKSLDEKILIHDSGNNWYVMSLLEQDSREDIKLGDNLYEEYHGIYFLTKKVHMIISPFFILRGKQIHVLFLNSKETP